MAKRHLDSEGCVGVLSSRPRMNLDLTNTTSPIPATTNALSPRQGNNRLLARRKAAKLAACGGE